MTHPYSYDVHDHEVHVRTGCRDGRNLPANIFATHRTADDFRAALKAFLIEGNPVSGNLHFQYRDAQRVIAITNTQSTAIGALEIPTAQAPSLLVE